MKIIEDFTFEKNDFSYILTLNASAKKFNQFLQEEIANSYDADRWQP